MLFSLKFLSYLTKLCLDSNDCLHYYTQECYFHLILAIDFYLEISKQKNAGHKQTPDWTIVLGTWVQFRLSISVCVCSDSISRAGVVTPTPSTPTIKRHRYEESHFSLAETHWISETIMLNCFAFETSQTWSDNKKIWTFLQIKIIMNVMIWRLDIDKYFCHDIGFMV